MSTSQSAPLSLQDVTGTLVLVGAGKMGGAMLEGWLALGLEPARVAVIEPTPSPEVIALAERGLLLNPRPGVPIEADAVIIAIKPQVAADILPTIAPWVRPETLSLSIMAGKTIAFLQERLPAEAAVIRAMPNTPVAIRRGMSVAVANARVTEAQRALAHRLLAAVGEVEWVSDERLMDAVTAVSGSGPAYVFLLAEALASGGVAAGLPVELAERLARVTVAGSGELLHRSALPAAILRENVTSPGGTTAAALGVLMGEHGLGPLMREAVAAAERRSRELAG